MKKLVTDNLALKLISLLIGIVLWLVVGNINNPTISKSFTVTDVGLVNEAYIDETGLVCLQDAEDTPVRVTITAERKKLSGISAADITAVADLQQAVSLETDPVMIPVLASCTGIPPENISVYPRNIAVKLEEKVTSEFMVSVNTGETRPGAGYEIGTQTVTPEKVRITGPGSLIQKIDKVSVNISVDGVTEDFVQTGNVDVIDKNGEMFTTSQMNNLRLENNGKVNVVTKLWKTRSDIGLHIQYVGSPAEGCLVESVSTVPETLTVAGTQEALDILRENENTLTISDRTVDISGASKDREFKLDISQYLPEGLKLTSGSSSEIIVNIHVLPEEGKRISIPTTQISVEGKDSEFQVAFEIDKLELRVISDSEHDITDFNEKMAEKIVASINVEGLDPGDQTVPVDITLPDGFRLLEPASTEIVISEISTAPE